MEKGAYKDGDRWISSINKNKKKIHLGQYGTPPRSPRSLFKSERGM